MLCELRITSPECSYANVQAEVAKAEPKLCEDHKENLVIKHVGGIMRTLVTVPKPARWLQTIILL